MRENRFQEDHDKFKSIFKMLIVFLAQPVC